MNVCRISDCAICLDVATNFILYVVIAVEGVQSSGAHDAHRQEANSSHLPDEDLRTRPTSGKVSVLVLCVDVEESEKDTGRDPVLSAGKFNIDTFQIIYNNYRSIQ